MRVRTTFCHESGWLLAGFPPPLVWSIAGSDCGGGAGLQADQHALHAFGVHACTVVAAITAQNSLGVRQWQAVDASLLDAQLQALAQDMPPRAIKTGMLGSVANVRTVCAWVDALRAQGHAVALVVDPVLGSSTGAAFADEPLLQAYRQLLLPRATVLTPNRAEAAHLLGRAQLGADQCPEAAAQLAAELALGTRDGQCAPLSVVITGGDDTAALASDWLHCPQARGWLSLPRQPQRHTHGTGCTFASTLAAALASGYCVADGAVLAKMATAHAIAHGYPAGQGAGPVRAMPDFALHRDHLPSLSAQRAVGAAPFAALRDPALGVYAVVDSVEWVRRVLASGIRSVQLRIKDAAEPTLRAQVQASIALAAQTPGAQLFINDHWQLALECGAYGVHLGQEDLARVDLDALRRARVRLGLSTHSYWEVARAWALRPSYIACGPIFATKSKDMPWIPQGLDNLRYWAQLLDTPVVGIGGIGVEQMADVAATGAASGAVISAITQAAAPEAACSALVAAFAAGSAATRAPGQRQ